MDKILFIGGRRQIYPAGPGQGPGGLWRGRALLQVLGNERVWCHFSTAKRKKKSKSK